MPKPNNYQFINLDYLNALLEEDNETKVTMLSILIDELPSEIKRINDAFSVSNYKEIKNASHKLKSTLAFVGNQKMATANKTIEQIAKEEQGFEKLPDLIKIMNDMQPAILEEVKKAVQDLAK